VIKRSSRFQIACSFLIVFALSLGAQSALAQETFDSLAGTWWFRIAGKDAGALFIEFSEPVGGTFLVRDVELTERPSFGFSRNLEAFFEVAADQELQLDSKGNVTGTIELTDPNGGALGELVIEKGKPAKKFTKLKLKATLDPASGGTQVVKLVGSRVPATFPVLTGIGPDGKLSGKKVKSKAYEIQVRSDEERGLPAYVFAGSGPAKVDGVEEPVVSIDGRVMLAPDKNIFGLLDSSSDFGTGSASGKLSVPASGVTPKLKLKLVADRKVNAKGKLSDPTEPVLSVTPTTFDFGAVKLDETGLKTFTVENVGIGELTGIAIFQSGSSPEFSFIGEPSFGPLENGETQEIVVEFDPATAGSKTAEILFSPDAGAGAKLVQLTGTGGVPEIAIDPTSGDFDDTTVGQSDFIIFTVTNEGDGPLSGAVTLAGSVDFALVLTEAGAAIPTIEYTLAPGAEKAIIVRFKPTATGPKIGTATFTGGGGATAALTGEGI
jgi:hypothetical protein